MRYAALTDPGKVREINEDDFYADGSIFIVADGMGGHQAGEVASTLAIETFLIRFGGRAEGDDIPRAMREAVREANAAIFREAGTDSAREGMGTTFTACVFQDGTMYLGHVGDSRAYVLGGGGLEQLTEDHSLVAELVRAGRITPEQALLHPRRNVITRALGIESEVRVDLFEAEVPARGWLLLCSDGLSGMLPDERISAVLAGGGDPAVLARALVDAALEAGGSDNVTVVLADLSTYDPAADRPAPAAAPGEEEGGGRSVRLLLWSALVLFTAAVIAFLFLFPLMRNRSYFVGVDERGAITLYRGFPWKPLGIDLKEVQQSSAESIDNLPEEKQKDLRDPVVKGLAEAERDFKSYTKEAETHRRVPDLEDLTWEEAGERAGQASLVLKAEDAGEGAKEPDPGAIIVGQNPPYGELVERDSVITVRLRAPIREGGEEGEPPPSPRPDNPSPPRGGVLR